MQHQELLKAQFTNSDKDVIFADFKSKAETVFKNTVNPLKHLVVE